MTSCSGCQGRPRLQEEGTEKPALPFGELDILGLGHTLWKDGLVHSNAVNSELQELVKLWELVRTGKPCMMPSMGVA